MKKLALVFLILIGGAGGAYYYFNVRKVVEKPTVTYATISQGNIREVVQSTGSLEALRTMSVGSQVSGKVKALYVDFNSIVHKGQLMAEIDPELLQVQVDIQNANVERQKGEIANQEVQLEDAKRQYDRSKALAEKQLVNQQQLEAAELTVKSRTTSLEAAKKQLLTTQASLDAAKLNVEYTKILAPMDGVVINRAVDTGVTVQSSMTSPTFFTLATDLRTLKLSAGVDEAEIGKIRAGMPVEFTVESYGPTTTFYGDVEAVRLNASTASNVVTYPVWINAPNPDLRLKPSMTANIRIIVGTENNVIRIPNQPLRFRPTSDMYTALGLTPPTAGGGRVADTGAAGGAAGAPGAAAADAAAGGGRRGGRTGGAAGGQQAMAGGPQAGAPPTMAGPPATGQAPASDATAGQGGQQRQRGQGQQTQGGQGGQNGQFQGRGGNNGQGGQGTGQRGQRGQGGQGLQGQGGQGGQGGRGQGGQGGRGGFDPAQFANMTPEQRQQAMAARGQGAGGRGQGGGGRGRGPSNLDAAPVEMNADKIDDLFPPIQRRTQQQSVWTWDEAKKELKQIRVTTGITDGQFTQMVNGDLKVGQQIVANIILPITAAQRQQNQNIFGNQPQRGGAGGFGPAGAGGGGFGGGGGAPGGGGGGGGRGGGGGGGRGGF